MGKQKLTEEERVRNNKASKRKYDVRHRQEEEFKKKYKEYAKQHRHEQLLNMRSRRQKWYDYMASLGLGSCLFCGYSKCQSALEFHHLDPKEKEAKLASWMCRIMTEERILQFLEEIKKCIRLCANCHRELHERLNTERKV